jgi:hypothetical protein
MTAGGVATSVVLAIALHVSLAVMTDMAEWDTVVAAASMEAETVGTSMDAEVTATSMDAETMSTTDIAAVEISTDALTMVITAAIRVVATSTEIVDMLTAHATRDV